MTLRPAPNQKVKRRRGLGAELSEREAHEGAEPEVTREGEVGSHPETEELPAIEGRDKDLSGIECAAPGVPLVAEADLDPGIDDLPVRRMKLNLEANTNREGGARGGCRSAAAVLRQGSVPSRIQAWSGTTPEAFRHVRRA